MQRSPRVAVQPKLGPVQLWTLSRRLHQAGRRRAAKIVKGANFLLFRAILPPEAIVGSGVQVRHYGMGTVIHPNTRMGDNVVIWHNVTIGSTAYIGSESRIEIGDGVRIGAGAILMNSEGKNLRIGAGAKIGAGAVIVEDVPAGATMVGPKATRR